MDLKSRSLSSDYPDLKILKDWSLALPQFEDKLKQIFSFQTKMHGASRITEAINYSLFSGGKRFRPMLSFASCQALGKSFDHALSWAMAVECIHTYSLIHDDLPCMDDDDVRRGQPTTHIKFDEATALLAGDALLTEAFGLLGESYNGHKNLGLLISLLSRRSGYHGMVSGQANDLSATNHDYALEEILSIHDQKTAGLISAACVGPFIIYDQDSRTIQNITELSYKLGLLFQLKDDFLDADNEKENNLVQSFGIDKTQMTYDSLKLDTENIMLDLKSKLEFKPFRELLKYNDLRTK